MKHPSLIVVIAIAVASAACSGDDTADPNTTPAPTQTSAAPTTTATPTTQSPTTQSPTTQAPTTTSAAPWSVAPTTATAATSTLPPPSSEPVVSSPFPTTPTGEPDWVPILQQLLEAGTALSLEPSRRRKRQVGAVVGALSFSQRDRRLSSCGALGRRGRSRTTIAFASQLASREPHHSAGLIPEGSRASTDATQVKWRVALLMEYHAAPNATVTTPNTTP